MPEMTQASIDALVDAGILAYRERNFKKAVADLSRVLDEDSRHWRAKLYLAMSLFHAGEIFTAYRHFLFLRDNCSDAEIRAKAETAIKAMSSQVEKGTGTAGGGMPEMTCTLKKPDLQKALPVNDDDDCAAELEWSGDKSKAR